jgi:DNA-binding transcriptional ArsR family regulator
MNNDSLIVQLSEIFKLLGDPTRLRIAMLCLHERVSVGAIAERLDLSVSLVSHHLRLLRAARLVRGTRRNRQVFYEAADDHITHMLADMIEHAMEDGSKDSDT